MNHTYCYLKFSIQLLLILITFTSCNQEKKINTEIEPSSNTSNHLLIRLNGSLPKKTIDLQSIANIEYIQLNTKSNSLIDDYYEAEITDSCIIICNCKKGDILFFDHKGSFISNFNNRGQSGSEYMNIHTWTYDPNNKEVYILNTLPGKRLLVYSDKGKFKRSFNFPRKLHIDFIFNYDEKNILVQKSNMTTWKEKDIDPNDYVLISKDNGKMTDSIISFKKRVSTYFYTYLGDAMKTTIIPTKNICNVGKDFIISDPSSDTIYTLNGEKDIKALFSRTPSLSNTEKPIIFETYFRNEKYLFGKTTFCNLKPDAPNHIESSTGIGIDLKTNKVFEPVLTNSDAPNVNFFDYLINLRIKFTPKNVCIIPIETNELQDLLSKNQLNGKLKEIAQSQNIEDNPVFMIINFNKK